MEGIARRPESARPKPLFELEPGGLDHPAPFGQLAADQRGKLHLVLRPDRGAAAADLLRRLRPLHDADDRRREPVPHRLRHGGRADEAEPDIDLVVRQPDLGVDNLPNVLPNIQGGRLRALAVTGTARDVALPDVPTFAEAGLPDYEVYVWFGFIGSASMPQPVRDRLSAAIIG
ncbi:MAG: hypothetical protein EON47_21735, partial [Acetobacteraceae bacterium]